MEIVNFKVACKSCFQSDGVGRMIMVEGAKEELYSNTVLKSEFELSRYLRRILPNQEKMCQFCGSSNLDVHEIEVDGKHAFVSPEVDQFQLVIMKNEDGNIEMKTGGSPFLPRTFLKEAFQIIDNAIAKIPDSEFQQLAMGNIDIIVSTSYVGIDTRKNRLENFLFVGFGKDEAVEKISKIKELMFKKN